MVGEQVGEREIVRTVVVRVWDTGGDKDRTAHTRQHVATGTNTNRQKIAKIAVRRASMSHPKSPSSHRTSWKNDSVMDLNRCIYGP